MSLTVGSRRSGLKQKLLLSQTLLLAVSDSREPEFQVHVL